MEKQTGVTDDVIELGVASVETKGGGERFLDTAGSEQKIVGLSDD